MTDYALRITISDDNYTEQYQNIYEKINNLPDTGYLVGPLETGKHTNKKHTHIYLKTDIKRETLISRLLRLGIIQRGNESYSCIRITERSKQRYSSHVDPVESYLSYCIKESNAFKKYITNLSQEYIQNLPRWIPIEELKKQQRGSIKQELLENYIPINLSEVDQRKHVLEYVLKYYVKAQVPFTMHQIRSYSNLIYFSKYEVNLHNYAEQIYYELNSQNLF